MGSSVPATDWQLARDHFNDHAKLRDGEVSYVPHNRYQTRNVNSRVTRPSTSFINFGSKIYGILPEVAGKGNFGVVRYAQSRSGQNNYVVKILDKPATRDETYFVDNEVLIAQDVGLVIASGARRRPKNNYQAAQIQYSVMPDLGLTLGDHLKKTTAIGDKFNLAIQLCLTISQHHQGLAAKSGEKVVHRDIKPANIMVKQSSKKVALTDYGLAQYARPSSFARGDVVGTPYYLPYMNRNTQFSSFTNEELDSLALKRCIYMPTNLYITNHGFIHVPSSVPRIFSATQMQSYGLFHLLDTSSRSNSLHSPMQIGALLILASSQQKNSYSKLDNNIQLQQSLFVSYFTEQTSALKIKTLISSSSEQLRLSKLWSLVGAINKSYLVSALVNKDIYDLLTDISSIPQQSLKDVIDKINLINVTSLTSIEKINSLRGQIGLSIKMVPKLTLDKVERPIKNEVKAQASKAVIDAKIIPNTARTAVPNTARAAVPNTGMAAVNAARAEMKVARVEMNEARAKINAGRAAPNTDRYAVRKYSSISYNVPTFYEQNKAIQEPIKAEIISMDILTELIRNTISTFEAKCNDKNAIAEGYLTTNKKDYTDFTKVNESAQQSRFFKSISYSRSLKQLLTFIKGRFQHNYSIPANEFNKKLFETIKQSLAPYDKNIPDDYNQGSKYILNFMSNVESQENEIRPVI